MAMKHVVTKPTALQIANTAGLLPTERETAPMAMRPTELIARPITFFIANTLALRLVASAPPPPCCPSARLLTQMELIIGMASESMQCPM